METNDEIPGDIAEISFYLFVSWTVLEFPPAGKG